MVGSLRVFWHVAAAAIVYSVEFASAEVLEHVDFERDAV
jgi:hypothetical protein